MQRGKKPTEMDAKAPSDFTIAVSPVISQPVAHFLVDGRHGLHVGLPPLPPQVLGLQLQQLQHVQLQHRLPHLQRPLQDGGRLEHHQHLKHAMHTLRSPVCWLIMNYLLDTPSGLLCVG